MEFVCNNEPPCGLPTPFREHHKEADQWADMGAKGRVDDRVDTARVAWSEVTGLCGFWDGSCDTGICGRVMVITRRVYLLPKVRCGTWEQILGC